ncbi:MAG: PIN domain-containing protein [Phenylobacterium sp.]|uniref:PIN domain-containing protein n=1 Tax=Phenylobacterium sp. TaxID=1871053 RepID=UPI001A5637AB|nr:PIN domain-containing protein [Phenylobacterium sp.]MBL8556643.1 PIN domain-containing protein [Phenylobacterium sp.]
MKVVLDASAILALVKREAGWSTVEAHIAEAVVSPVTLAECLGKAGLQGMNPADVHGDLLRTGLSMTQLGAEDVTIVATLWELARKNVSLADRFCLALGLRLRAPILTADRRWRDLGLPVELRFIR